jgi:hypothetical protein
MSVNSVSYSGGGFYVTDSTGNRQQVDLGTLMMMLNLDRTENLDKQIALQLEDIQKRNNTIKTLTEFLAKAREAKASGKDDDANITINGVTKPMGGSATNSWAIDLGIDWSDVGSERAKQSSKDDKATWDTTFDANISNIKGKIDTLNNDSQMDNIKLQNLLDKRGNAFEMATKVLDSNNQTVQSVIRNL